MKKKFMVYAQAGDYEVWAADKVEAARIVMEITFCRCGRIDDVVQK